MSVCPEESLIAKKKYNTRKQETNLYSLCAEKDQKGAPPKKRRLAEHFVAPYFNGLITIGIPDLRSEHEY